MQILLFEDHDRLAMSIKKGLADFGFGVDSFASALDGLSALKAVAYDGIVLDLGLPDRDGIDVLRELRGRDTRTPVLILTARDGIDDRVAGLDAGADDYVLKPFAMKELAARLRALLRRPGRSLGAMLAVGNLRLDATSRQATVNDAVVRFTPREIAALELLMRREGQVVSKAALENPAVRKLDLAKPLVAVKNTRRIGKRDMKRNDALPKIDVDPETYEVRADGELLVCEPASVLPMAQRYFLF